MTITVNGPDGSTFTFPDGMKEDEISSALESHYSNAQKPGLAEDVAKGAVAGTGQGIIAIPGTVGDVGELLNRGIDKGLNALGMQTPPLHPNPVSSANIQKQVEKVTGPFYEAKTGPGKAVQTAAQIAPSLALGGESALGTLAKAAGAGATSELAGEGAAAIKEKLPEKLQPWAEPVARATGAAAGLFTPGGARRMVTPLPMSDEQLATVNALRATNPELVNASSAGQLTESPRIASLEGRSPRMENLPQQQAEAYTQGVMRQAGAPDAMFDTAGLNQAQGTGAQLDALRNAHNMTLPEFANLNAGVAADRAKLFRSVGESEPFDRIQAEISGGPTGGNPQPLNMTGERYGALRQMIRNAEQATPTTHEQVAIAGLRDRLNKAFHNSMPPAEAERLKQLDKQYSNFKTIESIPTKPGENTLTPQQVFSKAGRNSDLETHADQASRVMTPLPKPNLEAGAGTKILGGALSGLLGGALGRFAHTPGGGLDTGVLSAFYGQSHANDIVQALKNAAGRVVANPASQAYLKNQQIRPGPITSADASTLARLLMTPQAKQLGPVDQSR